ncbi:MAG: ABC transporter substrate-binding protein, partial [Alphaproteobacteria bacterium]
MKVSPQIQALARCLAATAIIFVSTSTIAATAEGPPSKVVQRFQAALIGAMKQAATLGFKGRYETLAPAVRESFDLFAMTKVSTGRYWKKLSAEERDKLVAIFSDLTIATYADRFDGYSGQVFETLSEEPFLKDMRIVKTRIVKNSGEPVKLNYVLRPVKGTWRIIDIHLKGSISQLAMR